MDPPLNINMIYVIEILSLQIYDEFFFLFFTIYQVTKISMVSYLTILDASPNGTYLIA
jgi:hypothetical protein